MALLSPSSTARIERIKCDIPADVLESIKSYCEFANIQIDATSNDIGEFIVKSMELLDKKDRDWKQYKKSLPTPSSDRLEEPGQ